MKRHLIAGMALLAALVTWAVNMPMNPFTFVGRVMDAEHVAFGTNNVVTVTALSTNGVKLAQCQTYFNAASKYNYRLVIQLTDSTVSGYSKVGDVLTITVTDPYGKVWAGLVSAEDATVLRSGGIKELNIVLADTSKGYGMDNDLYEYLKALWEDSDYWAEDETFDVNKDYDGDGISTLQEAYAGTDPFNSEDVFKILDFKMGVDDALHQIVFTTRPGRAYALQTSSDLSDKNAWKDVAFLTRDDASAAPVTLINLSADAMPDPTTTVYLFPTTNSASFFRVKQL